MLLILCDNIYYLILFIAWSTLSRVGEEKEVDDGGDSGMEKMNKIHSQMEGRDLSEYMVFLYLSYNF
jgi:hypothetical protein